jgi:hypothetical protein
VVFNMALTLVKAQCVECDKMIYRRNVSELKDFPVCDMCIEMEKQQEEKKEFKDASELPC